MKKSINKKTEMTKKYIQVKISKHQLEENMHLYSDVFKAKYFEKNIIFKLEDLIGLNKTVNSNTQKVVIYSKIIFFIG